MNYLTILLCNRKPTMLSRRSKEKSQSHKEGVVGKYMKKDTPPELGNRKRELRCEDPVLRGAVLGQQLC